MDPARRLVLQAAASVLVPLAGVGGYLLTEGHAGHDPQHALQQLDLLYLDEPAPGVQATGRPLLLVFCTDGSDTCDLPEVTGAEVRLVEDRQLARLYGLGAADSRGYALVDARGNVRYRTYDPALGTHETEIQTLVDGLGG